MIGLRSMLQCTRQRFDSTCLMRIFLICARARACSPLHIWWRQKRCDPSWIATIYRLEALHHPLLHNQRYRAIV